MPIGTVICPRFASRNVLVALGAWLLTMQSAAAASVEVRVVDRNGNPVPEVVVTLTDQRRNAAVSDSRNLTVSMDQINMRFVPQLLVVPVGGSVAFPNSDSVSHQVYSFSPAKPFQLSLYKGSGNPPVLFDKPGLVVLGCNIHDSMVAYLYVTDAPLYGVTNARGQMSWNAVNSGPGNVTIWSPLLADAQASLSRSVTIEAGSSLQVIEFKLSKALRTNPQPRPRRADWSY